VGGQGVGFDDEVLSARARNADNISTKSGLIRERVRERPGLARELPHHLHACRRGETQHVGIVLRLAQMTLPGWKVRAVRHDAI
jgi:hypothetical protein